MSKKTVFLCLAGVAIGSVVLQAQSAVAPTSYWVTQVNGVFGPAVTMEVYRDGSKALIEQSHDGNRTRTLYDLTAHANYTWSVASPSSGCSSGTFSGDWGDPFTSSDVDELTKASTKPPASETVNGFATKVIEAEDPKSKIKVKVWREPKTGLIVKAEMTPPGGATATIIETKQFKPGKPEASLFVLPEPCAKAGPPAHVPTAAERFAAATGDDGANFIEAATGPGSPNSCTMLLRLVRAGSMQPLSNNYQVALDLNVDFDHPASYVMGGSPSGRTVFSGGHLKEYTTQIQNGVLRVDNVPDHFDLEITFAGGNAGAASALLYRKCAGPQTVLLYVVKNPDKISDGGDWMWVKAGKYATAPGH